MYFKDAFSVAGKSVRRRKTRSILTTVSVVIGVFSFLLVSSVSKAGEAFLLREVDKLGIGGISIFKNQDSGSLPLFAEDAKLLEERFKCITATLPIVAEYGDICIKKTEYNAVLLGVGAESDAVYDVNILFGRVPDENDIKNKKNVAVVDDDFALKNYKRKNIVGKSMDINLRGKDVQFNIVGVIESQMDGINQLVGNSIPNFVYLPYTTLNEMRNSDELSQITIKCRTGYKGDINTFVNFLTKVKGSKRGAYLAENLVSKVDDMKAMTRVAVTVISIIAGISLCVAGIGIMNIMYSSVNERKKEIGICIAIGATKKDILLNYILEASIISLAGGIIGVTLTALLTLILTEKSGFEIDINISHFIVASAVSLLCGIIFSAAPAMAATRTDPIKILK